MGYYKLGLTNGWTQIGVQFQNVGESGVIGLNDIKVEGLNGYDWEGLAPQDTLTIWDPSGQGYPMSYCWTTSDPYEMGCGSNVWMDDSTFAAADVDLLAGASIFIKTGSDNATITVCGEVPSETNPLITTLKLVPGYNQFANPFPVAISINDIKFEGLTGYDWEGLAPNDTLTIWDAKNQGYPTSYCWTTSDPYDMGCGSNVWMDDSTFGAADVVIPVGGSVFVKTSNGGTVTFSLTK